MSSEDREHRPDEAVTAEPQTVYRDADPGRSATSAIAAVNTALAARGKGMTHESAATFHDDTASHAAADALGARAFTAGNDVYFGAGQYAPGSDAGQRLIAHELTHVRQNQGVAPPEAGNFRVSSRSDAAEVSAREGAVDVGTATASTIFRYDHGGAAPAAGGAGPAAGHPPTTGPAATGGPAASDAATDPYDDFKAQIRERNRSGALSKWGTLTNEQKARLGTEPIDFQRSVVWTLHKDAPQVLKAGGVKLDNLVYAIFLDDEFEQWLPEMRTAGLLTPFLLAEPKKGLVSRTQATKLMSWVHAATTVAEAKAIFHKVYPTLLDSAAITAADAKKGIKTVKWSTPQHVSRLYEILSQFVPVGHVQTIQGVFLTTGAGYGWWEPWSYLVSLPEHGGTTSAAADTLQHGMTGGARSGATNTYTAPGGAAGANASLGHFAGTVLHEVGHGVGQRMGGNEYATNASSWPGWTPLGPQLWARELWEAPTGIGDTSVHENARKIDDAHARDFMITEITRGPNSYTYDPGWFSSAPPRNDVAKWLQTRYSNVPLQKWWNYLVQQGNQEDPSYQWSDTSARIVGDWCYGVFTRSNEKFMKFKVDAYNKKVSWYSLSSPLEWWAEQYAHYYRTERTGGGLIDPSTKAMLDRLDNEAWAPSASDGSAGVQYPTALNRGAGSGSSAAEGGGGAVAGGGIAAAGEASQPQQQQEQRTTHQKQPLFFPW